VVGDRFDRGGDVIVVGDVEVELCERVLIVWLLVASTERSPAKTW